MELRGQRLSLRPWRRGDEDALVRHADDRRVWRNLMDRFPHPYTRDDAVTWIDHARSQRPPLDLAIVLDGEPVGGIGIRRGEDLHRLVGDVGFWLGRQHWGRGLATEALRVMVDHAFAEHDFERLQATVLEWNPASCRVLEKAGFGREARRRHHAVKDDTIVDTWLYARTRDD